MRVPLNVVQPNHHSGFSAESGERLLDIGLRFHACRGDCTVTGVEESRPTVFAIIPDGHAARVPG